MSDFFADLESELLGAARRRAAGQRSRGTPRLAGAHRPALAAMVALFAAALVLAVVGIGERTATRDPVPATPPATPGELEPVAIFNGTTTPGLAGRAQERLSNAGGTNAGKVESWRSHTVRASRVVFGDGGGPAARRVAKVLGIGPVRAALPGEAALARPARVAVILGADQAGRPSRGIETVALRIAFLDASSSGGRAAARLEDRLRRSIRFEETLVDQATGSSATSRVLFNGRGRALATQVARTLGIAEVAPAEGDSPAALHAAPSGDVWDVIVVVGDDRSVPATIGPEARIGVIDASGVGGVARRIRRDLRSVDYRDVRDGGRATRAPESSVAYGPGARAVAERIATYLEIERVAPGRLRRGTDVDVLVGADLARR